MRTLIASLLLLILSTAASGAEPVARVDDAAISQQDLERALHEFAARQGASVQQLRQAPQFPQLRTAIIQSLVERELLWQAARPAHTVSDNDVSQAVTRLRTQVGGQQALERALQVQRMDSAALRERLRQDLTIQAYLQQEVYAGITITDAEVRSFYDANRDQFRSPDLLHLRALQLPASTSDAAATAAELRKQLQQGAKFADLARAHSADISAHRGGDLGFLNAEDLGPELATAAQALDVGAVSAPLQTPHGTFLLKLEARRTGMEAPLKRVRDEIREHLLEARRQAALRGHVQQLRRGAKIELSG